MRIREEEKTIEDLISTQIWQRHYFQRKPDQNKKNKDKKKQIIFLTKEIIWKKILLQLHLKLNIEKNQN